MRNARRVSAFYKLVRFAIIGCAAFVSFKMLDGTIGLPATRVVVVILVAGLLYAED